MRLLLAFDREYRVYVEALANAIRTSRPYAQVARTNTAGLEAEVERFDPQLVICSSPIPSNPVDSQLIASLELSPEPDQASRFRVGERYWESTNPTLDEILSVVDETNLQMDRERLYQEVDSAGWEPDGTFSDHLVIGNKGDLCLIVPSWVEGRNDPVYELHDVEKNLSYWVQQIPTPQKAAELLREHGAPPEEERGNPYRTTK